MQLVRDGLIVEQDPRYRSLVSLARNGSVNEVVVSRLTSRHQGTYVVRDQQGNLVSTTSLHVVEKRTRWRALLKSITVPSGMFVTLAGFILFIKRFPSCSLSQMIRAQQHPPPACPPAIHTQDYSVPGPQHPGSHCHPQPYKASSSWSPHPSPPGYTPVVTSDQMSPGPASVGGQGADRGSSEVTTSHPLHTKDLDHGERKTSFSVPGASDCLHSSEDCARFSIRTEVQTEGEKERWSRGNNFFSTLPLDTDTSDSCSIYTSDKLSFS